MPFYCDYCDVALANFTDFRNHVITQVHSRNKMKQELSIECMKKQVDRAQKRPEDLNKLLEWCQFHTEADIEERHDFFDIKNDHQASLGKELIDVLLTEIIQYRIMKLPQEMRAHFKAAVSESEEASQSEANIKPKAEKED